MNKLSLLHSKGWLTKKHFLWNLVNQISVILCLVRIRFFLDFFKTNFASSHYWDPKIRRNLFLRSSLNLIVMPFDYHVIKRRCGYTWLDTNFRDS